MKVKVLYDPADFKPLSPDNKENLVNKKMNIAPIQKNWNLEGDEADVNRIKNILHDAQNENAYQSQDEQFPIFIGRMKFRAVWIAEDKSTQLGDLTALEEAKEQRNFLRSQGRTAWLQDSENNRVDDEGKAIDE